MAFFRGDYPGHGVNDAWFSGLVKAGDFLAQKQGHRLRRVVASAHFGFLSWEASVQQKQDGADVFVCKPNLRDLQWQHLLHMDNWLLVPTAPCLLNHGVGPVGWQQTGDPIFLPEALCLRGLTLNKEQLLQLISHLGGSAPSGAGKRQLQELLIDMVLAGPDKQVALEQLDKLQGKKDEEIDSQFSEVLSELDKEEGNAQDIKDYKQTKHILRTKRKLQQADMEIGKEKRALKGKGRGRGRAKGRGRGRGRASTQLKGARPRMLSKMRFRRSQGEEAQTQGLAGGDSDFATQPHDEVVPRTSASGQAEPGHYMEFFFWVG